MNKIEETYNYILDNSDVFDTCNAWSNPTELHVDSGELFVRYLPNCFDCEYGDEDCEYFECVSECPIYINDDGTVNFNNAVNLDKEYFIEHWEFI